MLLNFNNLCSDLQSVPWWLAEIIEWLLSCLTEDILAFFHYPAHSFFSIPMKSLYILYKPSWTSLRRTLTKLLTQFEYERDTE